MIILAVIYGDDTDCQFVILQLITLLNYDVFSFPRNDNIMF